MSDPRALLDTAAVPRAGDGVQQPWFDEMEQSLADDLESWVALTASPDELTTARAWRLLNWPEQAATQLVRQRRPELVTRAATALSLLEGSPVERRESMVVGAVLRRGAELAGVDFTPEARAGCDLVGARGERTLQWLWWVTDTISSTHVEHGSGATFRFERADSGKEIDIEALERWAKGES